MKELKILNVNGTDVTDILSQVTLLLDLHDCTATFCMSCVKETLGHTDVRNYLVNLACDEVCEPRQDSKVQNKESCSMK